ncbi:2628_t:CDS:2 [Racocetra fulgida]|uniref:2628_t:CDS:1 n=1 Tax=Racocetra fulgida TaxID=60492 RepID=A0A9N8ZFN9_9GLOM|nr:2628_t:CDS:2 [Racocetra fulgida]
MTRKSEFKRHLRSNNLNIEKATISFLDRHVKYLQRKLKRSDISFNEYKSRLDEIEELKKKARLLNDKITSLGNENRMLRNENTDLRSVIYYGYRMAVTTRVDGGLLDFFQRMKRLFDTYRDKYEIDSSSLRISEIIYDVKPWKDLISNDEILSEICSYLSPEDLFFSLMQVEKLLYKKLWLDSTQTMWRVSQQQQPNHNHSCPIHVTKQQYCFLNFICKKCQICNQHVDDFALILELKIKICRYCREPDHLTLEQENNFPSELISTLHSVDYAQLEGSYLDYSVRELSAASHLVFYLKREVEDTFNEYLGVPANKKQEWLNKWSKVIREYYNDVLKIKHPTITDQYLIPQ